MLQTLAILTIPDALDAQIAVTTQVFAIMAGIEVHPSNKTLSGTSPSIGSALQYLVVCKGAIVLEASASVAFAFTERMMSVPTPASCDDDVKDALGELVNMIGGNLKGLLSPDTELSSPVVYDDHAAETNHSDLARLSCLNFECQFGLFRLSLYNTPN